MYQALLADARFHDLLLHCDRDLLATARAKRCAVCGGRLDASPFDRKPRGRLVACDAAHDQRLSLCCAVRDCRKRITPASLRFLGRKVYLGAVVVLVTAIRHGLTEARLDRLQDVVTAGPFWKVAAAALMPPVDPTRLPASLLDRFAGGIEARLLALLRFLAPISGGAALMQAL